MKFPPHSHVSLSLRSFGFLHSPTPPDLVSLTYVWPYGCSVSHCISVGYTPTPSPSSHSSLSCDLRFLVVSSVLSGVDGSLSCTCLLSPGSPSVFHISEWIQFFPQKFSICQKLTKSPLQLSGKIPITSKGLEEDDIQKLSLEEDDIQCFKRFGHEWRMTKHE